MPVTGSPITDSVTLIASVSYADTYFSGRLGASDYWTATADKEAALLTAQYDIVYCGFYTLPDEATEEVKMAICEQALFLLRDAGGVDARASLQAQHVRSAGIVSEEYLGGGDGPVIAPRAKALLVDCLVEGTGEFDIVK